MRRIGVLGLLAVAVLAGCAGAQRQGSGSYIDEDGVQLRAVLNSTGPGPVTYWFEWGRTPQLGRTTPLTEFDYDAADSKVVLYNLDHLDPDTTYYWRACARDRDPEQVAPGCSDIGSFKTLPTPSGRTLEVGGGWRVFFNARDRSLNSEGPYTFEGPAVVTVLDSYCASDRFRVFDNGVAVGTTPRVTDVPGCTPYVLTLEESLDQPEHYSRGSFPLGSGPHSIRVRLLAGSGNVNGSHAYLRADPLNP
jgi:hypothetical protein